jgi:toxin ParE1/3/4
VKTYSLAYPATEDLFAIQQWYDDQGAPSAGDRILQDITDKCEFLAKQPGVGNPRSRLGAGVRSFKVYPYLIFYRPDGTDIIVLRVLHHRRRITRRLFE